MTSRERFLRVLNFNMDVDRLPMVEWAPWWDKTQQRWQEEGLPPMELLQSHQNFGLDPMVLITAGAGAPTLPQPASHGGPIIQPSRSYDDLKEHLFTDEIIASAVREAEKLKPLHDRGEIIVRVWLDGYFWFPRTLFGIEPHLYAFYDEPDLMHRMNTELTAFNIRVMDAICAVLTPDIVGFAEDMSYNHGPMLSKVLFDEFLLPYYRQTMPCIKGRGIKVLTDSDGDITAMVPWLNSTGLDGVYPLERQAGVDLNKIRQAYSSFLMMGGYDKMVMNKGEAAMRAEFERLLPVMRSGGYIPSVDHQTPPGVSLEEYRVYLRLFREYAEKAVR